MTSGFMTAFITVDIDGGCRRTVVQSNSRRDGRFVRQLRLLRFPEHQPSKGSAGCIHSGLFAG